MTTYSLDGTWEFFYSPQAFIPGKTNLPEAKLFTGKMVTPGFWDDHYDLFDEEDFFGLTARFNPDYRKPHFPMGATLTPHAASSFLIGTGFYRKLICPKLPNNPKAILTVGPAVWGCSLFCNRIWAGSFTGYSTATDFDISKLLRPNEENEILLVVCNCHDDGGASHRVDGSHDGQAVGARPGQHRGLAVQGYQSERAGVSCGVALKITPKACLSDWYVSCEKTTPHWHVETIDGAGCQLDWKVLDGGKAVADGTVFLSSNCIDFYTTELPCRWSDDSPKLYTLELSLKDGETELDTESRKWGWRGLAITDKRILVNGIPRYFCGVTEHCYFAATTNPHWDKAKYLRELGVLRRANFNFIRCHTWCPPEPFYEACDELGIYVQTELPSVWSFEEAEAIIRQIRRHPCAVLLCEGNEKIIDEPAIERLRKLADTLHEMAPGVLFNPQEAMRGIEYEFKPEQRLLHDPVTYDPERLARVREFSDAFGCLGGCFSYSHDQFPDAEVIDRQRSIYGRPCLSHEAGILGGYLDFSLEERYRGTFIGTDLFEAARDNMKRHGVYQYARKYYKNNCRFISSVRKQLFENLRSCDSITGYDFLGGIDTHWHLIGYPCGIFNEFYEEKYGETIADVRRYNGPSILLCSAGKYRNRMAGKRFTETISLSHFGTERIEQGTLHWCFIQGNGRVLAEKTCTFGKVELGTIARVASIDFLLPDITESCCATLCVTAEFNGVTVDNRWRIWLFPQAAPLIPTGVRVSDSLTADELDFVSRGGSLLLTGGFPAATERENFRTHTSGRSLGHAGTVFHAHPIWNHFSNSGYADWQFFPMMDGCTSLVNDADMPPFSPIIELIPSFKLVRRKSLLSEFAVGQGRLMACGLKLDADDPAAAYMKRLLLDYLGRRKFVPAPEWKTEELAKRLGMAITEKERKAIDAGGRPI